MTIEAGQDGHPPGGPPLHRRQVIALAAGLGAAALALRSAAAAEPPGTALRDAATGLLRLASANERESLLFAFDAHQRHRWSYLPGVRPGLPVAGMGRETRAHAFALLRAGLSETGYAKAHGVMKLAAVLAQRRSGGAVALEAAEGAYVFALFGDPAGDGPWGWRVEGHHLSLNYTLVGGHILSATPHCICADPAEVADGPFAGLAVLDREDYMGRDLARSLDEAQFARAALDGPVPDNIAAGPGQARPPDGGGLSFTELTDETQRHVMLAIADAWFMNLPAGFRRAELDRLTGAARDALRFRWAGGFERSDLRYYRLTGPTLQIEYATRRRPDHIHAVWRDRENDFGRRALRALGYGHLPPEDASLPAPRRRGEDLALRAPGIAAGLQGAA